MTAYRFKDTHRSGVRGEVTLDAAFSPRFEIRRATDEQQRQGIDRLYRDRETGEEFTIEIKSDWTAAKTGRAFIETVSVDRENKPGWAYSSQADMLLYFIPPLLLVYAVRLEKLRPHMSLWERVYPQRSIPNSHQTGDYFTRGLLVPLAELENIAESVVSL